MVLMLASSQIPPGSPVIDGPQVIVLNSQITLTCTSPRGDPPPSVKWFFDDSEITTGISTTTAGTAVTTSLTFTATKNYHLEFLECQAENGVLQNPLSNTIYIEVHYKTDVSAKLTGPSTLTPGQQGIWTLYLLFKNGYPAGVMTMKNQNNNTQFTTEFTSSSVLNQKSFDVTGTLTWSPVFVNNGDTICCDVTYDSEKTIFTDSLQTNTTFLSVSLIHNAMNVDFGNNVTIGCVISANPSHTSVYWKKIYGVQAITIDMTNINKYGGGTVASLSLYIISADTSDAADYICFATNSFGTGQSSQGTLTVQGNAPSVSLILNAMNVDFGNNVTILCVISANPSHTSVYWKKISGVQAITIDMTNINKYGGGTLASPSLYIISADTSDAADYICFATNSFGTGQSSQGTLTVQGNAPSVSLIHNAMNVDFGNNVTIGCVISANPSHTSVYWKKISGVQAITIDMTNINKYGGGTVASPSLYIISADTSDAADYICFATNSFGTGQSSQGTLTVQGNAPSVSLIHNAMNVDFGNNVSIGCVISANPSHTSVYWKKISGVQAITIDMTNINKYGGGTVASPSLYIISADTSDAADYICFATNSFGTGQSSQGTLTVQGNAPSVSLIHNAMNVDFGNNVTIGCVISANPSHTSVYWKKVSGVQAITIDMTNTNKYGGGTLASPSLYIISADTSDAADYICFATNSFGTGQSSQGTLTVQGIIPVVTVTTSAYMVNVDSSITLECQVTADPTHSSVYWQKVIGNNTETLTINGGKYNGSSVSNPNLTISNTQFSDAGSYYCYARNMLGVGSSTQIILAVTGTWMNYADTTITETSVNNAVPDTTMTATTVRNAFQDTTMKECSGNQVIVPAVLGTIIGLMMVTFTAQLVRDKYKRYSRSIDKVSRRSSVVHPTLKESNVTQMNNLPVEQDTIEEGYAFPRELESGETKQFQLLPPIDNRQFTTDTYLLGRPKLLPIGKVSDLNV
ncbi:unnamed protein product [Mytilus edulis]|uniref:Ig-like domain-containing protein n=1 Tax=Mytilus edulis TaxID=6550 RepID=A0A8S3RR97_MYTED|nr:unnamed protein product [Mytilus edulis]